VGAIYATLSSFSCGLSINPLVGWNNIISFCDVFFFDNKALLTQGVPIVSTGPVPQGIVLVVCT
jgi:hypothetical protein